MKKKKLSGIDQKLTKVFYNLNTIAKDMGYEGVIDQYSDNSFGQSEFHRDFLSSYYDDKRLKIYRKSVRAINETGLKFCGIGCSRVAVSTTYYGRPIVLKFGVSKETKKEMKTLRSLKKKKLRDICLSPDYYWHNKKWGWVVAMPYAPISINTNKGCEKMVWPRGYRTEENENRYSLMEETCWDIHPFNVGFYAGKIWLIDYNCGMHDR